MNLDRAQSAEQLEAPPKERPAKSVAPTSPPPLAPTVLPVPEQAVHDALELSRPLQPLRAAAGLRQVKQAGYEVGVVGGEAWVMGQLGGRGGGGAE
jgi:hypothetical protein